MHNPHLHRALIRADIEDLHRVGHLRRASGRPRSFARAPLRLNSVLTARASSRTSQIRTQP
jgi:hypothetical protein